MALEKGIDRLVQDFIAAGRPGARKQSIDDRRAGYVASTVLAGETETRVQVETLVIDGLTFRYSRLSMSLKRYLVPSTTMAVVLSAVGLQPMTISSASWRFMVSVG